MAGLLLRRASRALRLSMSWGGALLYGRALCLSSPVLPARSYPAGQPIVKGLRPFRARLHRQRASVTALRALALAAVAAIGLLLLRLGGVGMPLLGPPLGAGAVFLACLTAIIWQRPSAPQMAHALDQRLGLREQIGSALDLEATDSWLATLLQQRAIKSVAEANPIYILPWPSLRRERRGVIVLGLLAGLCALIAAHAPPPHQLAVGQATGVAAARRSARAARHPRHAPTLPARLLALGTTPPARRLAVPRGPHGTRAARLSSGQERGGRGGGHLLPGNALSLQAARGHGHGAPTSGYAGGTGAYRLTPGAAGRAARGTATLHLTSGKNSAAGGVTSPQQQALLGLQNSIAAAQSRQGLDGAVANPGQAVRRNMQGQSQFNNGSGRRSLGRGSTQQGQSGARGRSATGMAARPGASSSRGGSNAMTRRPGYGGDAAERGLIGRGGEGTGPQSSAPINPYTDGRSSGARLANGQDITLNGAPGKDGRLILSLGAPGRAPGINGSAMYGAPSGLAVTVPGYVAPDSNSIAPDERVLIRQYFSPPATGG